MPPAPDRKPPGPSLSLWRVKERMEKLKLNPYSTAKKAQLGGDYVRDLLRGKVKEPSASKLAQLAAALECSPTWLLGFGADDAPGPADQSPEAITAEADAHVAELFQSSDAKLINALAEQIDAALRDAISQVLTGLDDLGRGMLFGHHGRRTPMLGRIALAHALGIITDEERGLLVSFSVIASRTDEKGFSLEGSWPIVTKILTEGLDYPAASLTLERARPLLGFFASSIALSILGEDEAAADMFRGEADRIAAAAIRAKEGPLK